MTAFAWTFVALLVVGIVGKVARLAVGEIDRDDRLAMGVDLAVQICLVSWGLAVLL